MQWLRSIIKLCGCDPFGQFSFYLLSGCWKDLHCMKSLASLFLDQDLQFRPATGGIYKAWLSNGNISFHESTASWFNRACRSFDPAGVWTRVLKQAIELGRQASAEDWHPDWFDVEFALWVEERFNNEGAEYQTKRKQRTRLARKAEREKQRRLQVNEG